MSEELTGYLVIATFVLAFIGIFILVVRSLDKKYKPPEFEEWKKNYHRSKVRRRK